MRAEGGGAAAARAGALLFVLALLAFGGALRDGFVWDDILIVEQNPRIRHLDAIPSFFTTAYWGADYDAGLYRPVPLAVHAVQFAFFHTNPIGYHGTNLLLHGLNVLLLYAVARRLFGGSASAWIAAALFAVHPAGSETVIGIVGLSGLLATFFGLLAWAISPRRRGRAMILLLVLLAALSKETGIVWIVPIALESFLAGRRRRETLGAAAGAAGAIVLYASLRAFALGGFAVPQAGQILRGADTATRFVTMLRGFAHYGRLIFWPATLSGDYSPGAITVSRAWDGWALAGVAFLLVFLAALAAARRLSRPAFVGLVLFAAALAPVSNLLFPIGAIIAERFLYLPMTGLAIAAAALLGRADRARRGLGLAAALLLILPLSIRSAARTHDWKDHETFMASLIDAVPRSYRAKEALAEKLGREGRFDEALRAVREARALMPGEESLRLLEARILRSEGKEDEAVRLLTALVREHPADLRARLLLGETLYGATRYGEALFHYREAARLRGTDPRPLVGMGRCLDELGRTDEAVAAYEEALRARPDQPDVSMRLGLLALQRGAFRAAADRFAEVTGGANRPYAILYRGKAIEALGDRSGAETEYRRVTETDPRLAEGWIAWARLVAGEGRRDEARAILARAHRKIPDDPEIDELARALAGDEAGNALPANGRDR